MSRRASIGGYDRSVHSRTFPALQNVVKWLNANDYSVVDPYKIDDTLTWEHLEDHVSSSARRNLSLINDTTYLSGCSHLALCPDWNQWKEGMAIKSMAEAMNKEIILIPDNVFEGRY